MAQKILHLTYVLDPGGTEKMLLRLLPNLQKEFDNAVICMCGPGEIGEELEKKKVSVFYLNHEHFWHWPRTFWRFRKLVKKHYPKVLNTYLPIPDIFGRIAGQILGIPKIICHLRSTNKGRYNKVILVDYLTSFLVTQYTVNSEAIIDHYTSKYRFKRSKFTLIPNFTDFTVFENTKEHSKIKEKLNLPDQSQVIACVGNLWINKGHRYLLEAFESVFRNHPNISLLLIGEGEQRPNLEEQIKNYTSKNSIHFLGLRTDVPDLLAITDIFVLPTFFEGQSNALIEAMASNCAIITTDIPENKILVKHDENGKLVPLKNSEKIADALDELLKNSDLQNRLAKNAQRSIQSRFNPSKILQKYREIMTQ